MRIQHNIMAMSAYRNYTNNVSAMKKNLEKLSSGYKINRAGDDAAGLAISEKMRAQITGLETAQKNAKDGISLVQTAEGALTEVHDMLNRMVELATQSANGTYDNTTDRAQMQKELDQLRSEINRIADSSNFNGIKLLDGSMSDDVSGVVDNGTYGGDKAAGIEYTEATNVVAWAAATAGNITNTAAAGKYVLHASATQAQAGSFTVDLSALKLKGDGTDKAAITLTIGTATHTFEASDSTATLTGKDIANQLKDYVFVISSTGTSSLVKATAANGVDAGDLIYKVSVGTGAKSGFVTFTADAIANKQGTAAAAIATSPAASVASKITPASGTNAAVVPDKLTDAQGKDFSLKMPVTAAKGTAAGGAAVGSTLYGWQNLGVVESKDTMKAGDVNFGNTTITVSASAIEDGMKMTVGSGSKTQTVVFKVSASSTPTLASGETLIDLSKLTGTTAAKNAALASMIANAFNDPAKTGGVVVGADGSNVTLSEYVNATTRTSLATADVQKAMSSATTFQDLVKFTKPTPTAAVPGTKTLTVDTNKIYEGNTLEITKGSGSNAVVEKYIFTSDKTGKVDSSTTKYVLMDGSNTAANLAAAIGGSNASASTANPQVTASNGKVTIKYTDDLTNNVKVDKHTAKLTGKKGLTLQIGDTADKFNQLTVQIKDMHVDAIGKKLNSEGKPVEGADNISIADISIADQDDAATAVDVIKRAINQVSDLRGTLGATQNRLDHTINNLSVMTENIQDAESTIRDVDVAEEMMAYTKNNILIQSAQAMLAQANQVPQGVLQLLQ